MNLRYLMSKMQRWQNHFFNAHLFVWTDVSLHAGVGLGQPSLIWVWIWKICPKNIKSFKFLPVGSNKMLLDQVEKFPGQSRVGLLFTAGQKYVQVGSGQCPSLIFRGNFPNPNSNHGLLTRPDRSHRKLSRPNPTQATKNWPDLTWVRNYSYRLENFLRIFPSLWIVLVGFLYSLWDFPYMYWFCYSLSCSERMPA